MGKRIWRSFDWLLLLSALLLTGIGIAMIHSATLEPAEASTSLWEDLVFRQALYAVIGLLLMLAISAIDYRFYQNFSRLIYVLGLGLLGLIFIFGRTNFGAKSWFDLQVIPLQPSELVKVVLILILAKYFSDNRESIQNPVHLVLSLALVAAPIALVYLQPDLGTAMILAAIWLGMAWTAGISIWQLGLLGLGGVLAAPVVWLQLKPYMRGRILAFFNPTSDPSGESYNVIQALISIGSGGLWGKGFLQGTQTQLHFLRVRHTDFIFSVFAEEFGFVGALVLFALFLILLWRVLRAAALSRDAFGRLIACGVAAMIFSQVFINLAVNLNVLPATGLPLPFVSYGGSSLLTMFIALGLVESVIMRHKSLEFE
jgi:rod shape determining protein RodA